MGGSAYLRSVAATRPSPNPIWTVITDETVQPSARRGALVEVETSTNLLAERWRARAEWLDSRSPAAADAYRRAAAELEAQSGARPGADPAQLDLLGGGL
jgi:hypothetical protein